MSFDPTKPARRLRWLTPLQGYLGLLLVGLAAGLEWGVPAGLGASGFLLMLDVWRPWASRLPRQTSLPVALPPPTLQPPRPRKPRP